MQKKRAVFNWSGGKDSALALYQVLQDKEYEIVSLLTTLNADSQKSSIHAIPLNLLEQQAKSIGLPLYTVALSKESKSYKDGMTEAVNYFKKLNAFHFIFGDIHLADVKKYREDLLKPLGVKLIEPLWGKGSENVIEAFLTSGLKTKIIVTEADKLDASYIGQDINRNLIRALPKLIDVCGENGEYHTFTYDGPIFKYPILFEMSKAECIRYDFKMENGEYKSFSYWQTALKAL